VRFTINGAHHVTELLPILGIGFALGMQHATDPDHVVAVSTIVSEERSTWGAALIGAAWGVGHSLTILAVGSAVFLLGWAIPPRLGLSMEFAVALMLLWLGAMTLASARQRTQLHEHAHLHGRQPHTHPHAHVDGPHAHAHEPGTVRWLDRRLAGVRLYQLVRPLLVGIVHGLAGSAAVALLMVATLGSSRAGLLYLVVFGVGTIAGMTLVTAGISVPFRLTGGSAEWLRRLRVAAGLLSLVFGCYLAWRVGYVEGLFLPAPATAAPLS
jgi:high-affinity nickel-transport protein